MFQEVIECVLFGLFLNTSDVLCIPNLQASRHSVNKDINDFIDVVHNEDYKYISHLIEYL